MKIMKVLTLVVMLPINLQKNLSSISLMQFCLIIIEQAGLVCVVLLFWVIFQPSKINV